MQAARTLDDILAIVPRHLMAAPIDLQAAVQHRVLGTTAHTTSSFPLVSLTHTFLPGRHSHPCSHYH
ncbi:hypothetical protein BGY98DRAFT_1011948, partial [Russula aff. rugulosa BPL654]